MWAGFETARDQALRSTAARSSGSEIARHPHHDSTVCVLIGQAEGREPDLIEDPHRRRVPTTDSCLQSRPPQLALSIPHSTGSLRRVPAPMCSPQQLVRNLGLVRCQVTVDQSAIPDEVLLGSTLDHQERESAGVGLAELGPNLLPKVLDSRSAVDIDNTQRSRVPFRPQLAVRHGVGLDPGAKQQSVSLDHVCHNEPFVRAAHRTAASTDEGLALRFFER